MATSILKQCVQYATWIWGNIEIDIRNIGGDKYGVGNISNGSVIEWLTPLMPRAQLLGYLQGLYAAKNNPAIFDKTPFDNSVPASVYTKQI